MKLFFALLLFIFVDPVFAQQSSSSRLKNNRQVPGHVHVMPPAVLSSSPFFVPQRVIDYQWDSTSPAHWAFTDTTVYTYNDSGNVLTATLRDAAGTNISRDSTTYNADQLIVERVSQTWNGTSWDNVQRYTNQYDSHLNVTEYRFDQWIGSAWSTLAGNQYVYTYSGNLISEYILKNWNGGSWINNDKYTNTFNANNQITLQLLMFWDTTFTWKNEYETFNTYAGTGELTSVSNKYWDATSVWINDNQSLNMTWNNWMGNPDSSENTYYLKQYWNGTAWYDSVKYAAVYDANHGYVATTQVYDGVSWNNLTRESIGKDGHHNLTGDKLEEWTGSWTISYQDQYIYNYNVNGDLLQAIYRDWDFSGDSLKNNSKKVYFDFLLIPLTASEISREQVQFSVFPNPFSYSATIEFRNSTPGQGEEFELNVFDVLGKKQRHLLSRDSRFIISKENLKPGVYFYTVTSKTAPLFSGKFIVE